MASTSTSRLALFKAVPGSAEPFRTSDLNSNWDKVDAEAVAVDSRLDSVELAVGASGSVVNATNATNATNAVNATTAGKATNIVGGSANRIPVQSAADTTTFINAPAAAGYVLTSQLTGVPAFNALPPSVPYKVQTGIISSGSWASGTASVTFTTAFDFPPIVLLTCLGTNDNVAPVVTLNAAPTASGFTARARSITVPAASTIVNGASSTTIVSSANAAPTTHWVAIQYSSSGSSS